MGLVFEALAQIFYLVLVDFGGPEDAVFTDGGQEVFGPVAVSGAEIRHTHPGAELEDLKDLVELSKLVDRGDVHGVIGLGGTQGTTACTAVIGP